MEASEVPAEEAAAAAKEGLVVWERLADRTAAMAPMDEVALMVRQGRAEVSPSPSIPKSNLSWARSDSPTSVARRPYSRKNLWPPCGDGGALFLRRPLRRRQRECLLRGGNRLLHVTPCVRRTHEGRFELRRRQVDSVFEHRAEETSEGFGIALGGGSPVGHWAFRKEPGKHRADAVVAHGNAGVFRCGRYSSDH